MLRQLSIMLLACLSVWSCSGRKGVDDPCLRFFKPYPDLITGRVVTKHQSDLLKGMEHYRVGEHERAAELLERSLNAPNRQKMAHLYLANSYLALGRPFDAELQLDHLENSNEKDFRDQIEWYTVVCLVCSGQTDRALKGAEQIANGRRHTYSKEARELIKALGKPSE